jgi:hypothetical protein
MSGRYPPLMRSSIELALKLLDNLSQIGRVRFDDPARFF